MFFSSSEEKKIKKYLHHAMHSVRYARRMKEDLLSSEQVEHFNHMRRELKAAYKAKEFTAENRKKADMAIALANKVHPAQFHGYGWRENVEVFTVVVAIALGIRTYVVQPYQIPTGSMQPTLYGITHQPKEKSISDNFPFNLVKFAATGAWYTTVSVEKGGNCDLDRTKLLREAGNADAVVIGGIVYNVPAEIVSNEKFVHVDARGVPYPSHGTFFTAGEVLASGVKKRGDNILVNRVRYNFSSPKRGDVVVFSTRGLEEVRPNTAYIKRLVGLPGETVSISDNKLLVNGDVVETPEMFVRQYTDPDDKGYVGYTNKGRFIDASVELTLGPDEYFFLGDNTESSMDGRYFGGAPGSNIIGPAVFVPWPFLNRGIHGEAAGPIR